jgi:hypothetical protein
MHEVPSRLLVRASEKEKKRTRERKLRVVIHLSGPSMGRKQEEDKE